MNFLRQCSYTSVALPVRSSTKRPYAARMPRDERREQLLDAALTVISREGYRGTTIEAVAREAGVTRPVVYGVFDNLGDLLETLLERQSARALKQVAAAVPAEPAGGEPDDAIVQASLVFLRAVAADPDTWRLILLPPEGTPSAVRDRMQRDRAGVRTQIQAMLDWTIAERGGPQGLDTELLAHIFQTAGEEAGRLVLIDPGRYPPERMADLAQGVLRAIGAGAS